MSTFNLLRTVSSVGFFAGGALLATGVTLLLTSPKPSERSQVGLSLSAQSISLYGGF